MQGDFAGFHAPRGEFTENPLGKMQSRGRRCHGPAHLGVDGLIGGAVSRLVAATYVGWQGNVAQPVEGFFNRSRARPQPRPAHAEFAPAQDFRFQLPVAKHQHFSRPHLAPGVNQSLPDVFAFLPGQKKLGFAGQESVLGGIIFSHRLRSDSPPAAQQAGREDLGVIENQQIIWLKEFARFRQSSCRPIAWPRGRAPSCVKRRARRAAFGQSVRRVACNQILREA